MKRLNRLSAKTSKKVCFIFSDFDSSQEYFFVLKSLMQSEYNIEVIILRDLQSPFIKSIESLGLSFQAINHRLKLVKLISLLKAIIKIKGNYQRIIVSGAEASHLLFFVSCLLNVEYVQVRHHSDLHFEIKNYLAICLDYLVGLRAKQVYAVSNSHKNYLVNREHFSSNKVSVIYGGFHVQSFLSNRRVSLESSRLRKGTANNEKFTFGVCSRLVEYKGIQYVISAFNGLVQKGVLAELLILGRGPFKQELESLIGESFSNHVKFVESVESMPEFFSSLDGFIHVPVREFSETFGMVYLESLASGIPCIFTKSGILHDLQNLDEAAIMVPHCDSDAILKAMLLVVSRRNSSEFESYPMNCLEEFTFENLANRYKVLINHINSPD